MSDGDTPYILHPMRVMLSLDPESNDARKVKWDELQSVAILHDAVERGQATWRDLKTSKMPTAVIRAVKLLTHDKSRQSYGDYIEALKPNTLARLVKLADLRDNARPDDLPLRLAKLKKDIARPARYAASTYYLLGKLSKKQYRTLMKRIGQ